MAIPLKFTLILYLGGYHNNYRNTKTLPGGHYQMLILPYTNIRIFQSVCPLILLYTNLLIFSLAIDKCVWLWWSLSEEYLRGISPSAFANMPMNIYKQSVSYIIRINNILLYLCNRMAQTKIFIKIIGKSIDMIISVCIIGTVTNKNKR